jgi:regulatory protein
VSLHRSHGRLRFGSNPEDKPDRLDERAIELAAVRLLTGRELSAGDLRRKLEGQGFDPTALEAVITRLAERGAISDDRFVDSFIRQHSQRGQGPDRIRGELRQRGVASEVIEEHLRTAEVDWDSLAAQVRARKFRGTPSSRAERAKQSRFLQYRGFTSTQIRVAMGNLSAASTVVIDLADDDAADIDP